MCGENHAYLLLEVVAEGSPPRVRGKPGESGGTKSATRITPACAGKTAAEAPEYERM